MPDKQSETAQGVRSLLARNRRLYTLNMSDFRIDGEHTETAAGELFAGMKGSSESTRWQDLIRWLHTADKNNQFAWKFWGLAVVTGALFIGYGLFFGLTLRNGPVLWFLAQLGIEFGFGHPATNLLVEMMFVGCFGGLSFLYYPFSTDQTPNHGPMLSVYVLTDGSDQIQLAVEGRDYVIDQFEPILREVAPHATLQQKTTTLRDELGLSSTDITQPQMSELTMTETAPYDGLLPGVTTSEILAGQSDSGLPLQHVIESLSRCNSPTMLKISAAARPKEGDRLKHRTQRFELMPLLRLARPHLPETEASSRELARIFDISICAMAFSQSAGRPATHTFEEVSAAFESTVNPHVTLNWREPEDSTEFLAQFDRPQMEYDPAYTKCGVSVVGSSDPRRNIPATTGEFWNYMLPGTGSPAVKQALNTTKRDQTVPENATEDKMSDLRTSDPFDLVEETDGQRDNE
jgi:hypothetical protein